MICTEEEARKKWCPMVRGIDHSEQCYATPWLPCAASNCMMWRWGESDEEYTKRVTKTQGEHPDWSAQESADNTPEKGYCGLGAKP
jgi:hypothetical protein